MADIKKYQINVVTDSSGTLEPMHPETDAEIVQLAADGIEATNVKEALVELNENIKSITGGGVVTGVKGEAESNYRLGQVNITKANIGLGNVNNTSDADKPISTATKQALDAKANASDVTASLTLKADKTEIPDVSNFITKAVTDLTNYYTKAETDDKVTELENRISAIPKFAISVVEALPTSGISETTIYLQKTSTTESGNLYTEYIRVNDAWESLGTQKLDLSGYATQTWVGTQIADFLDESQVNTLISTALVPYTKSSELATIAKSGKLSDATQDATHRVVTDTEKSTWNAKQNALTFDDAPTANSSNPVKSSGVYAADKAISDDLEKVVNGTTPAGKATKLATARTISASGDATGSASFDGSANADIKLTLKNSGVTAGTYTAVQVDAKGIVTKGGRIVQVDDGTHTVSDDLVVGGFYLKKI